MVERVTDVAREACNEAIDAFIDSGRCDFIDGLRRPVPDEGLPLVGQPAGRGHAAVRGVGARRSSAGSAARSPRAAPPPGRDARVLQGHARRAPPTSPQDRRRRHADLPARRPDRRRAPDRRGRPALDGMVLVLAGLDTTKSQLGYNFHYLATHPEDRRRLVEDPSLIPTAIEELLRFHAFVPPARKLKQDVEYRGLPDEEGADGADAPVVGEPRPAGVRGRPARSASTAARTATSPSAPARTGAPAPISPGASSSSPWRSGTSGSPTTSSTTAEPLVEHGWQCGLGQPAADVVGVSRPETEVPHADRGRARSCAPARAAATS